MWGRCLRSLRYAHRTAVAVGFGPRFLHSTGRLRRGGDDNGLFLQIVDRGGPDLPVLETGFAFGRLVAIRAGGDYQALVARGRRVLRVDVGEAPAAGVRALLDLAGGA